MEIPIIKDTPPATTIEVIWRDAAFDVVGSSSVVIVEPEVLGGATWEVYKVWR